MQPVVRKDLDTTTVAFTPATEGVDHNGIVVGKWKLSMLGAMSICVPNGLMSLFCPGVSLAQVCSRLGLVRYSYVILTFVFLYVIALVAAITNNSLMIMFIVMCSIMMAMFVTRIRFRVRYLFSIPGSGVEDCFYSFLCGCCVIAQMATHVESYEDGSCSFGPRSTLPGYTFG